MWTFDHSYLLISHRMWGCGEKNKAQIVIGCEDVERKIKHKKGLTKFDLTLSSRWRDEDLLFHDCSLTCQGPCLFGRLIQWHFFIVHVKAHAIWHYQPWVGLILNLLLMWCLLLMYCESVYLSCGDREAPMICGRELLPSSGSLICRVALSSPLCFYPVQVPERKRLPSVQLSHNRRVCPCY